MLKLAYGLTGNCVKKFGNYHYAHHPSNEFELNSTRCEKEVLGPIKKKQIKN